MLCPHCNQDLRYRERSDRTCGFCGKEFALEPKDLPIALNDARVHRLVDKLRGEEGFVYTNSQLRYAAARNRIETTIDGEWRTDTMVTAGAFVFITFVPTLPLGIGVGGEFFGWGTMQAIGWVLGVGLGLAVLSIVINVIRRPAVMRNHRITAGMDADEFDEQVADRWLQVYGVTLPGAIDERTAEIWQPAEPRYAVLSADRSVLVCLAYNAIARERGLALVEHPAQVPPEVPVLVVHDASPAGLRQWAQAREIFGPRATDVGLSTRTVFEAGTFIELREPTLTDEEVAALPGDLTEPEREWLGIGWWSPVAAIGPRKLIAAVEKAADRADPAGAAARGIGFLTWPTP